MPQQTPAWFDTLTASVQALGAAAREYRMAERTALNTLWTTDPTRLISIDGTVDVAGRDSTQDAVRPQYAAWYQLRLLYRELHDRTQKLYEDAAVAYAHGAATALHSVLAGDRPERVELVRRGRRRVRLADELPDLRTSLPEWPGTSRLAALREQVIRRERARTEVTDFEFFEDLADCVVPQWSHLAELAAGLGDSAQVYGETAESALHFVLFTGQPSRDTEDGR